MIRTVSGVFASVQVLARVLAGLALVTMVGITIVDVTGRYLFAHPLNGTITISSELLFPMVVFLTVATLGSENGHVSVDLLFDRTRGRLRLALRVLFPVLAAAFWAVIGIMAAKRAIGALEAGLRPIATFGIPIYVTAGLVALGAFLAMLQALGQAITTVVGGSEA